MDRYHKVEKPRQESAINENEIRITSQGIIRNYVSYATSLVLIFMHEDMVKVEEEEEEEGGVGEEDMVAMADMTITRVAMATIKEDMVVMVTIKVDMVDIAMIGVTKFT
ncbi:hypothetical protein BHE74_00030030 [Ensete ventricosum]|nr:hypothetical protein GW17_00007021 [Ensete ventricosum]RWW62824.1 hypothetical protein BHE74_00030030 [Ensete ventricosum]RZR93041.1 hypothetical protein BHM03_00021444 [Ensete ventricosum]